MISELLRMKVIEGAKTMLKYGLVVLTGGNLSARDEESGYVFITPSGVAYETLRPEEIVAVDLDGKIVEGKLRPSVDLNMHLAIYQARSDVFSIAHTHSTYATALSSLGMRLPDITSTLAYTNGPGGIDLVPYYHVFDPMLGKSIVQKMANRYAVLLQNHGVMACGINIHRCLQMALMAEQVSKIYLIAKSIREPFEMEPDKAREIFEHYTTQNGQE